MVGWIKMPLGTEIGFGPGNIVLDGDPAPPTERCTAAPHFSAHVYCGQTVAIISETAELLFDRRASEECVLQLVRGK